MQPTARHLPAFRLSASALTTLVAALLIGPEGGLSASEIEQAERAGFHAACFGPRVLRTETAPIVALTLLQQLWGDFR